jgi:hypothetical protein
MPPKRSNADNKLYESLIMLKRHLMTCKPCHEAKISNDPFMLCRDGLNLTLALVDFYDSIIKLRVSARNSGSVTCFPCPSLRAHGQTYELTAVPVTITGYQDKLT